MATLTIADLDHGKRDLETVDAVANSQADTTTTRYGQQTLTLAGALRRLGWRAPVPYAPGLNVDSPVFTVEFGDPAVVYRPDPSIVPFTTAAWDPDQWRVVQNTNDTDLVYQFPTLAAAETAAATLPEGSSVIVEGETQGSTSAGAYVADSGTPAVRFQDYSAVASYAGKASAADITTVGIAGRFYRRGILPANGGTVIKDALGRSWERSFEGNVFVRWFLGATGHVAAIQAALDLASAIGVQAEIDFNPTLDGPVLLSWRSALIAKTPVTFTASADMDSMFKSKDPSAPLQFTVLENIYADADNKAQHCFDLPGLQWPNWKNVHGVKAVSWAWKVTTIAATNQTSQWGTMQQCYGTDSGSGLLTHGNAIQWIGGAFNRNAKVGVEAYGESQKFMGTDVSGNKVGFIDRGLNNSFDGYTEMNNLDLLVEANSQGYRMRRHLPSGAGSVIDKGSESDVQFNGHGSSVSGGANLIRGGAFDSWGVIPRGAQFCAEAPDGTGYPNWWTGLSKYRDGRFLRMDKPEGVLYGGFEIDASEFAGALVGKTCVVGFEITGSLDNSGVDFSSRLPTASITAYDAVGSSLSSISYLILPQCAVNGVMHSGDAARVSSVPFSVPANSKFLRVNLFFANNISEAVSFRVGGVVFNEGDTPRFKAAGVYIDTFKRVSTASRAPFAPSAKSVIVECLTDGSAPTNLTLPNNQAVGLNPLEGDTCLVLKSGPGVLNVDGAVLSGPRALFIFSALGWVRAA